MPNTHYLIVAGDGQNRSEDLGLMDPINGLYVGYIPGTGTVAVNSVVRGATSGTVARVVRIISSNAFYAEQIGSAVGPAPGIPGGAFAGASTPFVGETLNFDNGATGIMSPLATEQRQHGIRQFPLQRKDAEQNSYVPTDYSDTVFWDPKAKIASRVSVITGSITGLFVKGDRVTTSSGGAFTIQAQFSVSGNTVWAMIRKTGTIAQGDILTNATRTGSAQIVNTAEAVEPDWATGAWVPYHVMPNIGGLGTYYELPPWGDGGGLGVFGPLARGFWEKWKANADPAERGVRVFQYSTFDQYPADAGGIEDATVGGVTLQRVKCSGTFPTTWVQGETVTCGGWAAKVWAFKESSKWLWVYDTNDAVLGGGLLLGGTSGANATCSGPAIGWSKGSSNWNDLLARYAAAQAYANPVSNGLYGGAAARNEGVFLTIWESELGTFYPANGAPWPTVEFITERWAKLIRDLRTALGSSTLPVTLLHFDARSHSAGIAVGGVAFATVLRAAMQRLTLIQGVTLATTEGMEPAQVTGLPTVEDLLYLRPEDYREIGRRAWRALQYGATVIPSGNFQPLPLVFVFGEDWASGGIAPSWAYADNDPDLFPAASFPGASTADPNILNFHCGALEWRTYDIEFCANSFAGSTGFGMEAPLMRRIARRFSTGAGSAEVGLIKCDFRGASVNGAVASALGTFDPEGAPLISSTAACRVSVIPAGPSALARGRFTAAAGTFASWQVGAYATVTGSVLGLQGQGGNNSAPWSGGIVRAKAGDGSYVEVEGTFVAEVGTGTGYLVNNGPGYSIGATSIAVDTGTGTIILGDRLTFAGHATVYQVTAGLGGGSISITPALTAAVANNVALTLQTRTFTLTQGPFSLAPEVERIVRVAMEKCVTDLRRIPKPVAKIYAGGDRDATLPSGVQAAMVRLLNWAEAVFGQRHKGETGTATLVMELSPNTPAPVPDTDVELTIQGQRLAVAAHGSNARAVASDDYPMESAGIYPRLSRLDNGPKTTPQGFMLMGRRADYVLSLLQGIPPHPDGEDATLAPGASIGSGSGGGTDTEAAPDSLPAEPGVALDAEGGGTQDIGTPDPVFLPLVVEDGIRLANADSYLSMAEFRTMAQGIAGNPTEISTASDAQVQQWLRLSARGGIDMIFGPVWLGVRYTETQSLDWPRAGSWDKRSRRGILSSVVPTDVKWIQFWCAMAMALGMDPLADFNAGNDDDRKRWATSISEALPGPLSESRTFGEGTPRNHILYRMHAAAAPFLDTDDGIMGVA